MRDVQSDVIDLYDEMSAYVLFLGAVVEVVNALEDVRRDSEEGGAQGATIAVAVPRKHGPWAVKVVRMA